MKKKILSILLMLCLSAVWIPVSAAQTVLTEQEKQLLQALDVISAEEDFNALVTRGRFMEMLSKIAVPDAAVLNQYSSSFEDVDTSSAYYPAVSCLSALGYVTGYSDGKFYPDEYILADHAGAVAVRLLGYHFMVKDGNYPAAAQKLKLFQGVGLEQNPRMTVADTAKMIYQILMTKTPKTDVLNSDGSFSVHYDDIYLESVLKITEVTGVITDNGITALAGASSRRAGELQIGDLILKNGTGNEILLGHKVRGYYRTQDDVHTLIAVSDLSETVTVTAQNIVSYQHPEYKYVIDTFDAKTKTLRLSKGFVLIYNGRSVSDNSLFSEELLYPKSGVMTFVDNDGIGGYDVLFVNSYQTIWVNSVDKSQKILYGKSGEKVALDQENLKITDANGSLLTISEIPVNSVAAVYESADRQHMEVVVSSKILEGTIDTMEDRHVTIAGGKFRCSGELWESLELGYGGIFYLDHQNTVCYFDQELTAGASLAYLCNAQLGGAFQHELSFQVFTLDGVLRVYRTEDSLTVDGRKFKSSEFNNALTALMDGQGQIRQLVLIRLGGDGAIREINTAHNGITMQEESLYVLPGADNQSLTFQSSTLNFGGKAILSSNTRVLMVPNEFDVDDLQVISPSELRNNAPYQMTAYAVKPDAVIADAVVIYVDCTGLDINHAWYSLDREPYVVEDIGDALDADGNLVSRLKLTNYKETMEMDTTDPTVLDITRGDAQYRVSVGDVVRVGYDKDGKINKNNIILLYDQDADYFEQNGLHAGGASEQFTQTLRVKRGTVEKVEHNICRFAFPSTVDDSMLKEAYPLDNVKVLIYDKENKRLITGDVSDLYAGADAVFHTNVGVMKMIIIYQ